METAYTRYIISTYLPKLNRIKLEITHFGKDFTNAQFADMFNVSVKTFNNFYSGKTVDFDLLIQLGSMYDFKFTL